MSKCPFWSTKKEEIECYVDCPMNTTYLEGEICPFQEYLYNRNTVRDIMSSNYSYLEDEIFDFDLKAKS